VSERLLPSGEKKTNHSLGVLVRSFWSLTLHQRKTARLKKGKGGKGRVCDPKYLSFARKEQRQGEHYGGTRPRRPRKEKRKETVADVGGGQRLESVGGKYSLTGFPPKTRVKVERKEKSALSLLGKRKEGRCDEGKDGKGT